MPPAVVRRGVAGACLMAVAALVAALVVHAGASATSAPSVPVSPMAAAQTADATPGPSATPASGQAIYDARCATCHGPTGMGDGPAAALLTTPPRDFTRGVYKFRSTASGTLPTDEDLRHIVAEGLAGTSMIGWNGIIPDAEQAAVVEYIKRFSPRFATEARPPITLAPEPPATPEAIDAGRTVYAALQCGACHGEDGKRESAVAASLQDDWGHLVKAAALDEPWTFRRGATARDIALSIKTGIDGTPMPGVADLASDRDIWNLAHFVRSLARKPVWEMTAAELQAHYADTARAHAANPVERGRELAEQCAHCHSPVDTQGRVIPGLKFAGGMRMTLSVWSEAVTANLTSDRDTGLGAWTDDEIIQAFTRGIKRDGTRMLPFPMGWSAWAHLTSDDQQAIVAFLRTIPPVRNRIPPRTTPGFFTYLRDKFGMLILGVDKPMVIYSGNAGALSEGQVQQ